MTEEFDLSSIKVLKSGAEAIRLRPEMYLRGLGNVRNALLLETLCLSLAEAHCGTCSAIDVEISGHGASVSDDGTGLSLDEVNYGKPFAEVIMTELWSCRDHKAHKELGARLCGVGIVVTNALSEKFVVDIRSDGVVQRQVYHDGEPDGPFSVIGKTDRTGTALQFSLAEELVGPGEFDVDTLIKDIRRREVDLSRTRLTIRQVGERGDLQKEWLVTE